MGLLGFGKRKEKPSCSCGCGADESIAPVHGDINSIKVLGAGCKSCHQLYENAVSAVSALNLSIEVEYVTDMEKIMEYGVMTTPAMVVNDTVVSTGKVLREQEIIRLLKGN